MEVSMLIKAFLVGGGICAIGQLLIDYTKLTPARILVSFVVLGVILGGLGLYQPLIEFAGAGATVPLDRIRRHPCQRGSGGSDAEGMVWRTDRRFERQLREESQQQS